MLTRKQHELVCFINDRLAETGVSPSFEEMKDALELKSKSGVHRLISALEERNFIRRLPNRARALEVLRMPERPEAAIAQTTTKSGSKAAAAASADTVSVPNTASATPASPARIAANDVVEIPLHGRIAAGVPIEAFEGSSMLAVPAALLGTGEHYALEVSGDSMVEAGILDGDYALIRRTEIARDGEIVVALIEDSEATLKYFRREGAMVRLDPANRAYDPQRYAPAQVRVQGKLSGILRRYD
ncbi:transcriptional repressor LexA [Sphingomonas sp. CFBP 13714]|uniref:transcriptional repressor LexA n=1 Tax=Sphingomonas sp. CFBP 13714 TaxID=2775308 RepID=UPI0017807348|nr:transcriptional repressor LexA [Sphingomonas sp. CFBP 13714]MBD8701137.1 transcriptional repressor LexA [Sphingomonas sp. CFBP 13714]